jgi:hypothetical protein
VHLSRAVLAVFFAVVSFPALRPLYGWVISHKACLKPELVTYLLFDYH